MVINELPHFVPIESDTGPESQGTPADDISWFVPQESESGPSVFVDQ
jgi:hypothetical protein